MTKRHSTAWRLAGVVGVLAVVVTGQRSAAQFNDAQSFDGTVGTLFAVPDGSVPYWSVADGCSAAVVFQDGVRGDNGSRCLRNQLPVGIGTRMIRDLNPGPGSSTVGGMAMSGVDTVLRLWVSADDGSGTNGQEFYRIQNVLYAVVTLEQDINPGAGGSTPADLFRHTVGNVYFSADDGVNGRELWLSHTSVGLTTTTALHADINPGPGSSDPGEFTIGPNPEDIPPMMIFAANDGTNGRELWVADANGANLIKDINTTAGVSSDPQLLTTVTFVSGTDVKVFFTADDGVNGRELWRTDGGAGGTVMLKDIVAGPAGSNPANLTSCSPLIGGVPSPTLFFTVNSDGVNGEELWKSYGAFDGSDTAMVYDPGAAGSPANITNTGLLPFFTVGNTLWRTNGTTAGTVMVKSFAVPPTQLVGAGNTLYFAADDGTGSGLELWQSSPVSATLVKDIRPGAQGSSPQNLMVMGGTVYFAADDGVNGRELWRTDATNGAVLVKDINPGPTGSNPSNLNNFDGTLVFTADDGTHGVELWQTDGFAVPQYTGMNYKWDLSSLIQDKTGNPAMIAVSATDQNPVSVYWLFDFPAMGGPEDISEAAHQVNLYVELTDGTDRVPLAVTNVDCGDGNLPRPTAPLTDGNNHNAIAFGMMAVLDQNPCDTDVRGGGSPGVPFAYGPAVYDGHDWIPMTLANFAPDVPTAPPTATVLGESPPPWAGYLHTGLPSDLEPATEDPWQRKRFAWARIDVSTDYMTVLWGNKQHEKIWVATLPRQYKGGFKALYAGTSACLQPAYPFYFDTVHISGGCFGGACCTDGICTDVISPADCADGVFMPCATCSDPDYRCCPTPWADSDDDDDVDMTDFAVLQRCYTGDMTGVSQECICLDHNNDDRIDQTDVMAFINCGTGPAVVPGSVPPGCGP